MPLVCVRACVHACMCLCVVCCVFACVCKCVIIGIERECVGFLCVLWSVLCLSDSLVQ